MEFRKLGEFCTVKGGKRLPKGTQLQESKTNHPYLRIKDFNNGNIDINNLMYISEEVFNKISNYTINKGNIFLSIVGTIGLVDVIEEELDKSSLTENAVKIYSNDEKQLSTEFLSYFLKSTMGQHEISIRTVGSTQPKLAITRIKDINVPMVDIEKQYKITWVLSNIDKKIKLNRTIIANLEELSQKLFKRWFVDFEFPDENGNPYKSSGGEMIDSELGEIPKNWSIKIVKEIAESFNSIRKPLSKLEREKRESIYPYYGATKIIDYVDNYIFDGKYILVGEDGTVQTETGNPFIQYVWGKFWVSNHAHILKGKLISDELLMLYLKNTNVVPYITGAVQPKLNKKNLNSIKFVIADKETIIKFENFIKSYFQKIRILNKENKKLIELRDTLLPKLMSGELEIPDDVEVNTDELSI
ncbi:restriction endonuclease subunit S [Staphylococcus sp. HMSC077B09]|uniref:restriction endonuclease subunit S n=1 Tax=Staphylococcus sp. HMSC077B09 TaxID=1715099 RepID=UPI0008A387E3|nr:restriction endonuclease subunit S [Staphylococcus sp. HMSC077B09]OFN98073.1 restriction endonuclease subunit S [Staphylococcus sp. HMSC077B09]